MKPNFFLICALFVLALVACAAPTPTPTTVPPTPTLPIPTATTAPTATIALPTASPVPPTSTPTRIPPTPTALAKDARGFTIFEAERATILAQPGVSEERARQVARDFEIAYQVVGEDLGYPNQRPRLYVYQSEDALFQDLVATWGYAEWFKTYRAIPRMRPDYVMWVPPLPRGDVSFIAHEYSHRIIEQLAGVNAQVNFKWFDEGLAEYAGLRALTKQSVDDAKAKRAESINVVVNARASGTLIRFKDMTTEEQISRQIERAARLAYAESFVAVDYLIGQRGIAPVKNTLSQISKGQTFPQAFQSAYAFSVDEFENQFLGFVAQLKDERDRAMCFAIDGQANDWMKFKPLIVDEIYPPIARAADVREVSAATCQGMLYLMIRMDGPASAGDVNVAFEVDTNGDGTAEYQPGFDRARAWIWNLKGTGYADQKNLTFIENPRVAVAQVAEFAIPLTALDNATILQIRVYTFVAGQMANRRTAWGKVVPMEGS